MILRERLAADTAAIALQAVTMLPNAIAGSTAGMAGHRGFLPLVPTADLPDNEVASLIAASAVMDSGLGYRFNGDRGFLLHPTLYLLGHEVNYFLDFFLGQV